jgi:ABC-type multidrug transport system fused ATPase/permease subunit
MRLRWNFHRHMLGQSMSFYQDEFAGRIAAKVMQTALAVRDTWMIVADILVFVVIYFVTMVAVVGRFDVWLLLPFTGWLVLYIGAMLFFVPRLGKVAQSQADARSLMTGRITDAYTNIATVKLFSHTAREAGSRATRCANSWCRSMRRAPGQRLRDRQPHPEHAADRQHRRRHAVAVDAGSGRRRCGRRGDRDGAAPERHLALGDVGTGVAVRTDRHGAGRHQHTVAPTRGRPTCRTRGR